MSYNEKRTSNYNWYSNYYTLKNKFPSLLVNRVITISIIITKNVSVDYQRVTQKFYDKLLCSLRQVAMYFVTTCYVYCDRLL